MSEPTFAEMIPAPQPWARVWKLEGDRGAITFSVSPTAINTHSRTQESPGDEPINDCAFVSWPCYPGGLGGAGRRLEAAWRAAGEDEAVIRTELEDWYWYWSLP